MADPKISIELLMSSDREGGYSNHSNDLGGETKYGISKNTFPNEDIKNLTTDRAFYLYKKYYWDPNKLGDLNSQQLADEILDFLVNAPPKKVITILQVCYNDTHHTRLNVDGIIGSETIKKLNSMENEKDFTRAFKLQRIQYYVDIVFSNRSQKENLLGWVNRALKA